MGSLSGVTRGEESGRNVALGFLKTSNSAKTGPGKGKPRERSISVSEMDTWIRSGAEGFGGI